MVTTLPLLRRSAIEAASQCLYRYKALWIDGVDDQSDYALRGIAFHAAAHKYILRLVERQVPADQEEAQAAFLEGISTVALPGRLIDEVRTLFDRWAEYFDLDLKSFVTAEEHVSTSDQTFTPDLVLARPDELEIRDFKTYYVQLTEVQARSDWQARWYIRNAMLKWPGFPRYRFTFDFVRFKSVTSLTFSPNELATLERDVEAVIGLVKHAVDTDEWPATPGPACSFCQLQCPVVDQLAIIPKRLTDEQAPRLAAWILATEGNVRLAKKTLKSFCASHGPVNVKGVEFTNRPVKVRAYPIDAVLAILKRRNIAGAFEASEQMGLTISHSALKKLFRQFPKLEEDLAPHVQESTTFRFGGKIPGGGAEGDEDDG